MPKRTKQEYERLQNVQAINNKHIFSAGLSEQCCSLKGDFMNMPIADNTFDAAYAIQATCYAPEAQGVYSEVYRVLKPGQYCTG
ncbi:Cycloartenol-C-24-methyltransferase 1 [Zea mays]|uniref:Cycloartenol-C-24-methyltransferase 1 n=1 Tax=Zea mays TaxID=4577 RepID=A0A3L6FZ20_MAIZE|nr:Cycloartenol-C-24-methyltransferase 1 [Zea mays]